eukprot:3897723-Alexandrium_andersonii.AAC.1
MTANSVRSQLCCARARCRNCWTCSALLPKGSETGSLTSRGSNFWAGHEFNARSVCSAAVQIQFDAPSS